MKKNKINKKGFAMAELLAVSIAILLLFSILFSNYLPLVAEFENRVSYTNVTANYAAFYVRKVYKEAMESNKPLGDGKTLQAFLSETITNSNTYYQIYKEGSVKNLLVTGTVAERLQTIIDEYEIEEIIITTYKLDKLKGLGGYGKQAGSLYGYIQYLPKYAKSGIGTKTTETYRIILKTKSYGYATTQILSDPPTPLSCFGDNELLNTSSGFVIQKYYYNPDEGCGESVSVTPNAVTQGGVSKTIVGIANDAFKDSHVSKIYLPSNVKTIGANAFRGNNISSFNFETDAPGVTQVGSYAFAENDLSKIVIPGGVTFGEGAFANNLSLTNIQFDFPEEADLFSIPKNMFALLSTDGNSERNSIIKARLSSSRYKNISLFIPYNIQYIGAGAFKNIKFSGIEFENDVEGISGTVRATNLKTIGDSAFAIEDKIIQGFSGDDDYIKIIIPNKVETIDSYAFQNVQIGDLAFAGRELTTIKQYAFAAKNVNITDGVKAKYCVAGEGDEPCEYLRYLNIPVSVKTIGNSAFSGQKFTSIDFNEINETGNIVRHSSLTSIGNEAFAGNEFSTITMPVSLKNAGPSALGSKIFGSTYTLGKAECEILLESVDLFTTVNWCQALYGASCTDDAPDPRVEEGITVQSHVYTYNSDTKYVSYVEEG